MAEDREDGSPEDADMGQFEVLDEVGEVEGWDDDMMPEMDEDEDEQDEKEEDGDEPGVKEDESVKKDMKEDDGAKKDIKEEDRNKKGVKEDDGAKKGLKEDEGAKKDMKEEDRNKKGVKEYDGAKKGVKDKDGVKKGMKEDEGAKKDMKEEDRNKKGVKEYDGAKKGVKEDDGIKKGVKGDDVAKKAVKEDDDAKKGVMEDASAKKGVKEDASAKKGVKEDDRDKKGMMEDDGMTEALSQCDKKLEERTLNNDSIIEIDITDDFDTDKKEQIVILLDDDADKNKGSQSKELSVSKDAKLLKDSPKAKDEKSLKEITSKDGKSLTEITVIRKENLESGKVFSTSKDEKSSKESSSIEDKKSSTHSSISKDEKISKQSSKTDEKSQKLTSTSTDERLSKDPSKMKDEKSTKSSLTVKDEKSPKQSSTIKDEKSPKIFSKSKDEKISKESSKTDEKSQKLSSTSTDERLSKDPSKMKDEKSPKQSSTIKDEKLLIESSKTKDEKAAKQSSSKDEKLPKLSSDGKEAKSSSTQSSGKDKKVSDHSASAKDGKSLSNQSSAKNVKQANKVVLSSSEDKRKNSVTKTLDDKKKTDTKSSESTKQITDTAPKRTNEDAEALLSEGKRMRLCIEKLDHDKLKECVRMVNSKRMRLSVRRLSGDDLKRHGARVGGELSSGPAGEGSGLKRKGIGTAVRKPEGKKIKLSDEKTDYKKFMSDEEIDFSILDPNKAFMVMRKQFVKTMIALSEDLKCNRDYRRWAEKRRKDGMVFPVFDLKQPAEPILLSRCQLLSGYENSSNKLCLGFPRNNDVIKFWSGEKKFVPKIKNVVRAFEDVMRSCGKPLWDPVSQQGYFHGLSVVANMRGKAILQVDVYGATEREGEARFSEVRDILLTGFSSKKVDPHAHVSSIYVGLVIGKKTRTTERASVRCIMGCGFIVESIDGMKVNVYPWSCFSTGTHAMTALCEEMTKIVRREHCDIVVEIGCGTGVIGQVLSRYCSAVLGVDTAECIAEAKVNAEGNSLSNCTYYDGRVKDGLAKVAEAIRNSKTPVLVIVNGLFCDLLDELAVLEFLQVTEEVHKVAYIKSVSKFSENQLGSLCEPKNILRHGPNDPMPFLPLYAVPLDLGNETFTAVMVLKHVKEDFLGELYAQREKYSPRRVCVARFKNYKPLAGAQVDTEHFEKHCQNMSKTETYLPGRKSSDKNFGFKDSVESYRTIDMSPSSASNSEALYSEDDSQDWNSESNSEGRDSEDDNHRWDGARKVWMNEDGMLVACVAENLPSGHNLSHNSSRTVSPSSSKNLSDNTENRSVSQSHPDHYWLDSYEDKPEHRSHSGHHRSVSSEDEVRLERHSGHHRLDRSEARSVSRIHSVHHRSDSLEEKVRSRIHSGHHRSDSLYDEEESQSISCRHRLKSLESRAELQSHPGHHRSDILEDQAELRSQMRHHRSDSLEARTVSRSYSGHRSHRSDSLEARTVSQSCSGHWADSIENISVSGSHPVRNRPECLEDKTESSNRQDRQRSLSLEEISESESHSSFGHPEFFDDKDFPPSHLDRHRSISLEDISVAGSSSSFKLDSLEDKTVLPSIPGDEPNGSEHVGDSIPPKENTIKMSSEENKICADIQLLVTDDIRAGRLVENVINNDSDMKVLGSSFTDDIVPPGTEDSVQVPQEEKEMVDKNINNDKKEGIVNDKKDIENDQKVEIENDQKVEIKNDQNVEIENDQKVEIENDKKVAIDNDKKVVIDDKNVVIENVKKVETSKLPVKNQKNTKSQSKTLKRHLRRLRAMKRAEDAERSSWNKNFKHNWPQYGREVYEEYFFMRDGMRLGYRSEDRMLEGYCITRETNTNFQGSGQYGSYIDFDDDVEPDSRFWPVRNEETVGITTDMEDFRFRKMTGAAEKNRKGKKQKFQKVPLDKKTLPANTEEQSPYGQKITQKCAKEETVFSIPVLQNRNVTETKRKTIIKPKGQASLVVQRSDINNMQFHTGYSENMPVPNVVENTGHGPGTSGLNSEWSMMKQSGSVWGGNPPIQNKAEEFFKQSLTSLLQQPPPNRHEWGSASSLGAPGSGLQPEQAQELFKVNLTTMLQQPPPNVYEWGTTQGRQPSSVEATRSDMQPVQGQTVLPPMQNQVGFPPAQSHNAVPPAQSHIAVPGSFLERILSLAGTAGSQNNTAQSSNLCAGAPQWTTVSGICGQNASGWQGGGQQNLAVPSQPIETAQYTTWSSQRPEVYGPTRENSGSGISTSQLFQVQGAILPSGQGGVNRIEASSSTLPSFSVPPPNLRNTVQQQPSQQFQPPSQPHPHPVTTSAASTYPFGDVSFAYSSGTMQPLGTNPQWGTMRPSDTLTPGSSTVSRSGNAGRDAQQTLEDNFSKMGYYTKRLSEDSLLITGPGLRQQSGERVFNAGSSTKKCSGDLSFNRDSGGARRLEENLFDKDFGNVISTRHNSFDKDLDTVRPSGGNSNYGHDTVRSSGNQLFNYGHGTMRPSEDNTFNYGHGTLRPSEDNLFNYDHGTMRPSGDNYGHGATRLFGDRSPDRDTSNKRHFRNVSPTPGPSVKRFRDVSPAPVSGMMGTTTRGGSPISNFGMMQRYRDSHPGLRGFRDVSPAAVSDTTVPWLRRTSKVHKVVYIKTLRTSNLLQVTSLCTPGKELRYHSGDPLPFLPLYALPIGLGTKNFAAIIVLQHVESNFVNELYHIRDDYPVQYIPIAVSGNSVPFMVEDTKGMTKFDKMPANRNRTDMRNGPRNRSLSGSGGPGKRSQDRDGNYRNEAVGRNRSDSQHFGDCSNTREEDHSSLSRNVWMNEDGLLTTRIDASEHGSGLPPRDLRDVLQSRSGHHHQDSLLDGSYTTSTDVKDLRTVIQGKRMYAERHLDVADSIRDDRYFDDVTNDKKRRLDSSSFAYNVISPGTEDLRQVLQEKKVMGENILVKDRNMLSRDFQGRSMGDGRSHYIVRENDDLRSFLEENRATHNNEGKDPFRDSARLPHDVENWGGAHPSMNFRDARSGGSLFPTEVWRDTCRNNEPEAFPLVKDSSVFERDIGNKMNVRGFERKKVLFSREGNSRNINFNHHASVTGRSYDDAELGRKATRAKRDDIASGFMTDVRGIGRSGASWKTRNVHDSVRDMENIHDSFSKFDAYMSKSTSHKDHRHGGKPRLEFDQSFPSAGVKTIRHALSPNSKHHVTSDNLRENQYHSSDVKASFYGDADERNKNSLWLAYDDRNIPIISDLERKRTTFEAESNRTMFDESGRNRLIMDGSERNRTFGSGERIFGGGDRTEAIVGGPDDKNINIFGRLEDRKISVFDTTDIQNRLLIEAGVINRPIYGELEDRERSLYGELVKKRSYGEPEDRKRSHYIEIEDRKRPFYGGPEDKKRLLYGETNDRNMSYGDSDRNRSLYGELGDRDDRHRPLLGPPDVSSRSLHGPLEDRNPSLHGPLEDRNRSMRGPPDKNRSIHGPPEDRNRSMHGPPEDRNRSIHGPPEDRNRSMHGLPEDRNRSMHGPPEDRNRPMHGPPEDRNRSIHGPPEDRNRSMHGLPEDRNRSMQGPPEDRNRPMQGPPEDRNWLMHGPPDDRNRSIHDPLDDRNRSIHGPTDDRNRSIHGPTDDRNRFIHGPPEDRNRSVYGSLDNRNRSTHGPPEDRNRLLHGPPENRTRSVFDKTDGVNRPVIDGNIGRKLSATGVTEKNRQKIQELDRNRAMTGKMERDEAQFSGRTDINRSSYAVDSKMSDYGRGYGNKDPLVGNEPVRTRSYNVKNYVDHKVSYKKEDVSSINNNQQHSKTSHIPPLLKDFVKDTIKTFDKTIDKRHRPLENTKQSDKHTKQKTRQCKRTLKATQHKDIDTPLLQPSYSRQEAQDRKKKSVTEADSKFQGATYENRTSDKKYAQEAAGSRDGASRDWSKPERGSWSRGGRRGGGENVGSYQSADKKQDVRGHGSGSGSGQAPGYQAVSASDKAPAYSDLPGASSGVWRGDGGDGIWGTPGSWNTPGNWNPATGGASASSDWNAQSGWSASGSYANMQSANTGYTWG